MYATVWFYNKFGSLVRRTYEDEESLNNAITQLRDRRISFHLEYGEDE